MKKVLILTNKDDITVDFVVMELQKRKIDYYRLNMDDIPEKIKVCFDFNKEEFKIIDTIKNIVVNLGEVTSVYFRRPLLNKLEYIEELNSQEKIYLTSELAFIHEGIYKILENKYWLNNVYDIREAENKIYQLQLAKEVGFKIPMAFIGNEYDDIKKFSEKLDCSCIIKPIKSGNMKDLISPKVIYTTKLEEKQILKKESIEAFPVFIEENVKKKIDLRCIVVGNEVFTAEIYSQEYQESKIDWRKSKQILEHRIHDLPENIKAMCVKLTHKLNLNYSAIDLILDSNDNYVFLEINPNGQWAWLEKRLKFPISKTIVDILVKEEK